MKNSQKSSLGTTIRFPILIVGQGENAIQSLRKNEMIGVIALEKICSLLNLQPGDLMEYIPDDGVKDNGPTEKE
ncbi:MAG: helix-turn-helix transcriptional regulator [Clostridium sp.]|nr:helix-turn-helix transcriptional regulator [Clostridium sp.]